jgi:hypothetical protein
MARYWEVGFGSLVPGHFRRKRQLRVTLVRIKRIQRSRANGVYRDRVIDRDWQLVTASLGVHQGGESIGLMALARW